MDWNIPSLTRIDAGNTDQAATVCYEAFKNDPVITYVAAGTATPDDLKRVWAHTYRSLTSLGTAYATSEKMEGIAAWLPSNLKMSSGQAVRQIPQLFKLGRAIKYASRFATINQVIMRYEKQFVKQPHVTLALLAVAPEHQGKGYASKLLKPVLERLDKEGLACFLDTELENNVRMYHHLGFEVVRETTVPKTDLKLWMMLRQPRS